MLQLLLTKFTVNKCPILLKLEISQSHNSTCEMNLSLHLLKVNNVQVMVKDCLGVEKTDTNLSI